MISEPINQFFTVVIKELACRPVCNQLVPRVFSLGIARGILGKDFDIGAHFGWWAKSVGGVGGAPKNGPVHISAINGPI